MIDINALFMYYANLICTFMMSQPIIYFTGCLLLLLVIKIIKSFRNI